MNRLLFLYVLITGLPLMAQIPTNGLKGHYPFDGTLTDYSSNGNDIITGTGTYVDDRFGNANGALSLDGITDSLVLPIAEFSPIQGDFTISFWYKTNSPSVMNLFSSKQTPADTTNNFELQLSSHNSYYLENYKQVFYQTYAYWNGSGIASNAVAEGAPGLFTKGEWSHFAISREADTFRIYRNHQLSYLSVETNFGGTIGDAVAFVFSASPYHFKGTIDDLRLYDRFLEPNEIDVLWFENAPFIFSQVKPTNAYVQGSNVFVAWDYDTTQISDSILVEYRVNNGAWTPSVHSNLAYEYYTYIDMSYAYGTTVEVRVSDFINPALTQTTGQFSVSEYDWEEVDDTLPFDAKDGAGLLTFQNKMWLLGGWDPPHHEPTYTHSQVWSSTDGANWVFETDAPWPARHAAAWLVANDAMWVIGGDPQSGCLTDVWKSSDGINWTQTNNAIPGFVNRNNQNYAAINDQLFVYGGEQCSAEGLNEVWRSNDGITWNQLPNAPWSGRGMQVNSCVDGSGQLWMLGGSNEGTRRSFNEVWKSADGINWTLVNESAPWNGRYWHTVAWFDNKMWLMGGIATGVEVNDVWYSDDGINWKELKSTTGNWPDGTRHAQSTTVFDNALWYMCGISTNNSWKIRNMQTLGMETMKESSLNLNVFPNPTTEQLTISFSCVENQPNTIQVVNVLGVVMKEVEMTVSASNCTVQLNTGDFPDGVYIVHAKNQQHQSVKFVKQ